MDHCGLDGAELNPDDVDVLVGRTVGRYRIERRIGMGGVAIVYRARHTVLGAPAAVKILLGEMACRVIVAERFHREAHAMSRIIHPNVVRIVDFGVGENGLIYQAMELIEGKTLAQEIARGPLELERTRRIALDVARGLSAAHRLGFVHRDLKPSNIMLARENGREVAKILDFGLVGLAEADPEKRLTQVGVVVGTPHYMAPELIDAAPPAPSADLYSLGVTLYETLAGKRPFEGDTIQEILIAHVRRAPAPLRVGGELQRLVMRLLAKQPEDRPRSADEVVALLESERPRTLGRAARALALVAVACVALGWWIAGDAPPEPIAVAAPFRPAFPDALPPATSSPSPAAEADLPPSPPPPRTRKARHRRPPGPVLTGPVEVSIESSPPGVRVSLEGGGVLGRTPMTAILSAERPVVLVFEDGRGHRRRVRWRSVSDRVMVRF